MKALAAQSYLTLWNPMDCCPPGSSVHGILQAVLEWVAISFSRGFSRPRDQTHVPKMSLKSELKLQKKTPKLKLQAVLNLQICCLRCFSNIYWFNQHLLCMFSVLINIIDVYLKTDTVSQKNNITNDGHIYRKSYKG